MLMKLMLPRFWKRKPRAKAGKITILGAVLPAVTEETLAGDRILQRDIHKELSGLPKAFRPWPMLILADFKRRVFRLVYNTFRLKRSPYVYFFFEGKPIKKIPPQLKKEDVIGSGIFLMGHLEVPFNKPLLRARAEDGVCQVYNSKEGKWQTESRFLNLPLKFLEYQRY